LPRPVGYTSWLCSAISLLYFPTSAANGLTVIVMFSHAQTTLAILFDQTTIWDFFKSLLTAQTGELLTVFGMLLVVIAVIGAVQGKFDPGSKGRLASGILGIASIGGGVWLQLHPVSNQSNHPPSMTPPIVSITESQAKPTIANSTPASPNKTFQEPASAAPKASKWLYPIRRPLELP
jgi:hypothetical protein